MSLGVPRDGFRERGLPFETRANADQLEAILAPEGPVLIIAGPGSGPLSGHTGNKTIERFPRYEYGYLASADCLLPTPFRAFGRPTPRMSHELCPSSPG